MDEDQYRNAYNELNPNRCVFEKAITNQRCDCELKHKFVLATREGVACKLEAAQLRCTAVLDSIRNNARFSLKVVTVNGPMPHNKELQVQAGGMLALQQLVVDRKNSSEELPPSSSQKSENLLNTNEQGNIVHNIFQTVSNALLEYKTIENLPYGEIVKSIVSYQSRPKRCKK